MASIASWFPSRSREGEAQARAVSPQWRRILQHLGIAWAVLLALFWRDAADMVAIWWDSSTFNHCLLIVPLLGWLVWQRKEGLLELTPQPWWPPLLYTAVGAFGWLLGDAAGLALARQLGLVMMLQGSASALLGANVTRGLLFPLFYMLFLVPMGEELVPPLQTLTAKMCMVLLALTGIPAHIDGIFITTPGGYFKVAEACSGVKFLVAMIALGALIANLCFKSWPRRAAFMAACVIIPILANGLRAFGTIYIAQHGNIEFAASFDHVFYGWIFFGIVIALVIGGGWKFFDRRADEPAFDASDWPVETPFALRGIKALAIALALAGIPVAWAGYISAKPSPVPAKIALPQVPGWQLVPYAPKHKWTPRFDNASHYLFGRYRNAKGQEADFFAVVYDRQAEGRELVGYGQGAVDPDSDWAWAADRPAPSNGRAEYIKAPGPSMREVVSFYRVDGVTTGSASRVKLATMQARLFGGNQQAVAIVISAEQKGSASPRLAIDAFAHDVGNINKLADRLAGLD